MVVPRRCCRCSFFFPRHLGPPRAPGSTAHAMCSCGAKRRHAQSVAAASAWRSQSSQAPAREWGRGRQQGVASRESVTSTPSAAQRARKPAPRRLSLCVTHVSIATSSSTARRGARGPAPLLRAAAAAAPRSRDGITTSTGCMLHLVLPCGKTKTTQIPALLPRSGHRRAARRRRRAACRAGCISPPAGRCRRTACHASADIH